jgi:hypothetical protein
VIRKGFPVKSRDRNDAKRSQDEYEDALVLQTPGMFDQTIITAIERVTTGSRRRRYSDVLEWCIGSSAMGGDGSNFSE